MPVYIVLITYIYGTFEKESQWRGATYPADAITLIIYTYIHIYTQEYTLDPKFDVEPNGTVYSSSVWSLGCYIAHYTAKMYVFVRPAHATSL